MKKICYKYWIFIFILSLNEVESTAEYTLEDIARVENKAIENRQLLKNWHIRISLIDQEIPSSSGYDPDKVIGKGRFTGMELYKKDESGNEFRDDRKYLLNGETYVQKNIWGKKWFYRFGNTKLHRADSDEDIPFLEMIAREKQPTISQHCYDARTLGFVPGDIRAFSKPLTSYIGSPDRTDIQMMDDMINGVSCYKITFSLLRHRQKNLFSIWIAPDRGYSPLKFEIFLPEKPEKQTTIIDVEVNNISGFWFPSLIQKNITRGGNLFYKETLKIETISLNRKLDPNLFNEKGLNLPIGTLVMMDPEPAPDTFTWDGEKIVGLSGATLEPVALSGHGNTFRYFLIAAGLALISIACLLKYFELRKRNQNSDNE